MSFCPKCGREIMEESLGCPICSMMGNSDFTGGEPEVKTTEPEVEKVDAFTVEDEDGVNQRFEKEEDGDRKWGKFDAKSSNSYAGGEFKATQTAVKQNIPTALKVIVIIAIFMTGTVGKIAGLIAGGVMMKSPIEDYRKFGKTILIISVVFLVLGLLLITLVGLVNVALLTTDIFNMF